MTGLPFIIGLLIPSCLISVVFASPVKNTFSQLMSDDPTSPRQMRAPPHLIEECLLVGVEAATYYYKSKGTPDVCGLYLVSDPDQRIEITIDYLHTDCEVGGLLTLLDGWEMSGEVFPQIDEDIAPVESRVLNLCGHVKKRTMVTSSNAATILYKMPTADDSFKVTVNYVTHPKPCNIILTSEAAIVTLRNHGLRSNCTLATSFPASIKVIQISVGVEDKSSRRNHLHYRGDGLEVGITQRCHKRGFEDMVLVGGSPGLDTSSMHVEELYCGLDSNPRVPWSRVLCDVSAVRLVSSGRYDNSVTVSVAPLTSLEELPTTMCDRVM